MITNFILYFMYRRIYFEEYTVFSLRKHGKLYKKVIIVMKELHVGGDINSFMCHSLD